MVLTLLALFGTLIVLGNNLMGSNSCKFDQAAQPGAGRGTLGWEAERLISTPSNLGFGLRNTEAPTCSNHAAICDSDAAFGRMKTHAGQLPRQRQILESRYRSFLLWLKGWITLGIFGFLFCFIWAAKHLFLNINVEFYSRRNFCGLIKHPFPGLSRSYIIKKCVVIDYLAKGRTRKIKHLI